MLLYSRLQGQSTLGSLRRLPMDVKATRVLPPLGYYRLSNTSGGHLEMLLSLTLVCTCIYLNFTEAYVHSGFRAVEPKNYRNYFKKGRVLRVLWAEPAGHAGQSKTTIVNISKWTEQMAVKIRWFLVVQPWKGHCIAVSVHTYGGRGVTKYGVDANDHAALVAKGQDLILLPGENLNRRPLHLILEDKTVRLDPASRINFSKVCTVEYNVKVSTIGGLPQKIFLYS